MVQTAIKLPHNLGVWEKNQGILALNVKKIYRLAPVNVEIT